VEPVALESAQEAVGAAGATRRSVVQAAWFFLLLALANLMWAGQGPAVKFLDKNLGPIALTFLPFYVATVLLIPLLALERRGNPKAIWPNGKDWKQFAAAGIFGQIAGQLGATWGILLSTSSNFSILNLLIPVLSAVMATFMLRERMTGLRLLCLFIGLVGVFLLSAGDLRQASFINTRYLLGNFLILIGCMGSAYYNVYCKGLLARYQQTEILIYSFIVASVASVPLLIWVEPFHFTALGAFDWKAWTSFAFLAIFMYALSMVLFFYVLRHLDVTVASFSLYLVPVFGVALSFLLVGERLNRMQILGTGVVLAATLLIMKYDTLENA
jgi:drug/metabolite transporter (DMT)-like permease